MSVAIDHLVIGASTLEQGVAYVRETLGVEIPFGGVHPTMGTHNHLMSLGGDVFLEVIAINPAGDQPLQPRWYGLDDPFVQAAIRQQPALLGWVVNTTDLAQLLENTDMEFGVATRVNRGDLSWLFGLPEDGRLLAAGMLPYLIEWQTEQHPAINMADLNCTLESVEIRHSHATWIDAELKSIGADKLVRLVDTGHRGRVLLIAQISTPTGMRTLAGVQA